MTVQPMRGPQVGRSLALRKSSMLTPIANGDGPAVRLVPPVRVRGMLALLIALGAGLIGVMSYWSMMSPMQSAVVASGQFRVSGDRLVVQHLEGGIVRRIAVKEGDLIGQGEVIAELDDTAARNNLRVLQNQLMSTLATQARLQAEFHGATTIEISPELQRMIAANPSAVDLMRTEQDVFEANQKISSGLVQILAERISQLKDQTQGFAHRKHALEVQVAMVQEELVNKEDLFKKNLVTKADFYALRRSETAISGDILVAETQQQTVLQQIAETQARQLQVRRDRLKEITESRQQADATIFDLRQRTATAQAVVDRMVIRAPQAGRVVGLQINTVGEVIAAGQELLELVPSTADYVIEVKVSPTDINQVAEGGKARIRLSAYNYRTTPMVEGTVQTVSADSLIDAKTGASYFKVSVRLVPGALAALPNVQAVPGMPAQVMIATGEQTIADYLLMPILGGYEVAMAEND